MIAFASRKECNVFMAVVTVVAVLLLVAFGRSNLAMHNSFEVKVLHGVIVRKSLSTTHSASASSMIHSVSKVWNGALFKTDHSLRAAKVDKDNPTYRYYVNAIVKYRREYGNNNTDFQHCTMCPYSSTWKPDAEARLRNVQLGKTVKVHASKHHNSKQCIDAKDWNDLHRDGLTLLIASGVWLAVATAYVCTVCTVDETVVDGWFGAVPRASTAQGYELVGIRNSMPGHVDSLVADLDQDTVEPSLYPNSAGHATDYSHFGATVGHSRAAIIVPASAVLVDPVDEEPSQSPEGPTTLVGCAAYLILHVLMRGLILR